MPVVPSQTRICTIYHLPCFQCHRSMIIDVKRQRENSAVDEKQTVPCDSFMRRGPRIHLTSEAPANIAHRFNLREKEDVKS